LFTAYTDDGMMMLAENS